MIRTTAFLLFAFILLSLSYPSNNLFAQNSITFQDVSGQTVTLEKPAERILLGEGRSLLALALIDENPIDRIAGWMGDFHFLGQEMYNHYKDKFPAIEDITLVGRTGEDTFSIEKALSTRPDVAIFGINGHGPGSDSYETIRQLNAAGIPVVFVDFRQQPFDHTLPSMRVLGKVIGQEEKAEAYIEFYQSRMNRISERISELESISRPKVLLEMHAGAFSECCSSPGNGSLGEFIEFAGGQNIGADVIPGALGLLSMEYILSENPDVYIGTGVERSIRKTGINMGSGVDPQDSRESLKEIVSRTGISSLSAVQNDHYHAIWHNFYNLPVNILAAEAIAKWIHPELFEDIDPAETLQYMNEHFLAVPMRGTFWVSPE
ncbi:ABC transporter substrate-binding protein [Rhodohalobacter sp. 614A]|uniref:ABC transporter substrate-binding protein n=1 Tax=Rhodohalobacter sp. 614A TaxID=2908649 RepID=UPI001F4618BE|nr:ABC transporter substrate-binding protein [Rhodohalobacter sp. 614A]